MPYTVEVLPTAREELAALPKNAQRKIAAKIDSLKEDPRPPDAKILKATAERLWRVRAGDYRIVYSIEDNRLVVLVIRVANRRDVYEGLEVLVRRLVVWRGKQGRA